MVQLPGFDFGHLPQELALRDGHKYGVAHLFSQIFDRAKIFWLHIILKLVSACCVLTNSQTEAESVMTYNNLMNTSDDQIRQTVDEIFKQYDLNDSGSL